MLGLIRRIGTDFGISVLVASHLLGELERVSDHVVVIDAGRLLRSSSTADATAASQLIAVEVTERTDELAAALRAAGLGAQPVGTLLEVDLQDDTTYDIVRDAVAGLGRGTHPDGTPPAPDGRDLHHARREPMMATTGQGVIHDLGYRHYDGARAGRRYIAAGPVPGERQGRLRPGPVRQVEDHADAAAGRDLPARVHHRGHHDGDQRRRAGRRLHLLRPQREPPRHGLRRGPVARERLARPAVPRRVAVLLPPAGAHRLRPGQVRRDDHRCVRAAGAAAHHPVRRRPAGEAAAGRAGARLPAVAGRCPARGAGARRHRPGHRGLHTAPRARGRRHHRGAGRAGRGAGRRAGDRGRGGR